MKKLFLIVCAFFSVMATSAMTREEAFAVVDSAYDLAMSGDIQQAIALNNDGLSAVPEDSMDIRCEFYSCLLYCYHRLGDYQQALSYGEACLAFDEQQGDPANISASLGNLAGIYSSAGQQDVAIAYLERAITIEQSLLAADTTHSPKSLAIRKAMLGEVLLAKSKSPEAGIREQDSLLHSALRLTEEALVIDRSLGRRLQEGMRLAQLGHIYEALNDATQAKEYTSQALTIARETGNKMTEVLCLLQLERYEEAADLAQQLGFRKQEYEASDHLYMRAKKAGRNAEALTWLERARGLHEQLMNEESQRQLTIAQVKYDTFRKEQQLADQQQELQRKQARLKALLIFSLLALSVIALLVVLVILLRHRKAAIAREAADKKRQYGILSHDLRNPVMAQQQLLQLLYTNYAQYKPEEAHKLIGQLLAGSDNQLALLRNLQEIVQLDRQARVFRTSQLDLAALLRDTIPDVQSAALLKDISIELHAERMLVKTDRELIRTVLRNLLSNAIKFSPRGSTVEVGTVSPAAFYVRDRGTGMSREQIAQILTSRKQIESSIGTDGESGTGYGLILCRELLSLCNAKMDIQSVQGEGTTFTIDLQNAIYPVNKYENRYTR
ncbi:MAG: tetratricopeptide repeat protein [Paludibacteraceae bacterium]|nr:tetratricopeptide repeat protein [Paludibacteraceae bacterium]